MKTAKVPKSTKKRLMRLIGSSQMLAPFALLLLLVCGVLLPSGLYAQGQELYSRHCASCHHPDKIGLSGPPLLPEFIGRLSDEKLVTIIRNGLSATLMPAFADLSKEQAQEIVDYLRKPVLVKWSDQDIKNSLDIAKSEPKKLQIRNIRNITPVVERDGNKVWIMEDDKILDKFGFVNVHGGIKYTPDASSIYVPSRDGWIGKYSLKEGRYEGKVRACVSLRNIAVSKEGKFLYATCLLPKTLVTFDAATLGHVSTQPLEGKISALYELYSEDKALFTYRDRALLGILDSKTNTISYKPLEEPIEDFFIEAFDRFLIGTSRNGTKMVVYDLVQAKKVFEYATPGMPHLFSATYWYKNGRFYFATPHMGKSHISVWQMYDWKFVKTIDVGGKGFFVKTHPNTPYLWIDNGSDELVLVSKKDYSIKKLIPAKGKKFNHTEFSGDGKYAYLSINEKEGALIVYDTATLSEITRYSANMPVGKYNFVNKNRVFYRELFGEEIFSEKCWGCHHQTSEAFGPSFRQIANTRSDEQMIAHIHSPKENYRELGYQRSLMPKFDLSQEEVLSIVEYIKSFKDKERQ